MSASAVQHSLFTLNFGHTTQDQIQQAPQSVLCSKIETGAPLLIAFGSWNQFGPGRFEWWGVMEHLHACTRRFNLILVRDSYNRWYQRGVAGLGNDVLEVAQGIQQIVTQIQPSHVVTLGASMGAYAAMMFGALLGVHSVLAFGPLAFLDASRMRELGEWRWLDVMDDLQTNPPLVSCTDLTSLLAEVTRVPEIHILYGHAEEFNLPNLDPVYANLLGTMDNVYLHSIPQAIHPVAFLFKRQGMLEPLLLELLEREFALFPHCQYANFDARQRRQLNQSWLAACKLAHAVPIETRFWICEELSAGRTSRDLFNVLADVGWPMEIVLEAVHTTHYWWQIRQTDANL